MPGALTVGQIDVRRATRHRHATAWGLTHSAFYLLQAQLRHTGEEDADEGVQTTGVVDASFTGSGQRLGRSGEGQPWWARALDELERRGRSLLAPSRSSGARAPGPDIDPTLPTLSLRIRLAGAPGEHTVTMNTTHTVQDLFCTVKEIAARERGAQPGRRTALLAGFPPARLDPAATTTLQDAGLASALVREVVEHG